jgi:hypothetical protein
MYEVALTIPAITCDAGNHAIDDQTATYLGFDLEEFYGMA